MSGQIAADFDSLVPEVPFNRRGFLVTALGAGFALAVQPVMAQTAIATDTQGLAAGEIKVKTADGEMVAYRAQPASGSNFPVILVVSEIFGVHEYIADTCRRLAKLGYQAIAPELFARHGDPRKLTNIQEILTGIVAKVPDAQVMSDLDACVAWAKVSGGDTARLGITGFCWGGRIVWLYAAHNPQLKAGVAWYGRLVGQASALTPKQPTDLAGNLKAPVLGLYGGADAGIPLDTVWDMQDKLKAAGGKSMIHVYDDAPHAFHADYRPSYRKEVAEDGWKRMREWFGKNGV
ncbi:MAG: dienelactone hydrolase family protein [Zoogloeaceae bacterium]|jgi:carboxymethylenebutenolidase|uniref:Carboxymethylenebutenolidase n=1 Tax=Candidatus Desulfobacillus denitrificans TaxID=2608985 RepID=A0A809QVL5_9PROT|nr:dienelactone hydrolase family protein [Zoogloeaceae bacterium]MBP9652813.1 dienelactone hydrolase family protein [Rhodocyclaceae bacterium]MCZ2173612.1 dienelactone hydrolase family protein [Burkholderiales bacterium]OQY74137.1 MAG: carboxymethylenebutenolidase [Rhodocyclaceae bacterium UTPRO2]BBO19459.1 carboxymethylenebutenolidase [Candidatus Desulfobacillus denitrificans]GIK45361.1 MAG: hydrolase [Betaproteobacteria bacterium]